MLQSSDVIEMIDADTRRIAKSFGDPSLAVKIYDELRDDVHLRALLAHMEGRGLNEDAFAGVGIIYKHPKFGSAGDIQVYGRSNPENPEDVFPYSIVLATGENLPRTFGRACLEETVIFGKEAELYLSVKDPKVDNWLKRFAV